MNRKLLALAVTAAFSLPMAAHAAPTIYGQLNLSVDMVDAETTDVDEWQVNSNSSRLGVKGEEALGGGFSAVYKAEWAVSGDEAGSNDLTGRDRFVGLKNQWGTVKLGAYDSPLKTSQGAVDQFNDMTYADMANFISGDNRLSNVIGYESPKIADMITINVALQSGEDTGADPLAPGFVNDDDGISASIAYDAAGLYVALGMDKDVADSTAAELVAYLGGPGSADLWAHDAFRLTGTYTMDAFQIGALIQKAEATNSDLLGTSMDEKSFLLSAAFTMGDNVIKGQYVKANYDLDGPGIEVDRQGFFLGFDHNFTQMTKVYAQAGMAKTDIDGADSMDDKYFSVGMLTKF